MKRHTDGLSQQRSGLREAILDVKSRDESGASSDEKNLEAKIETERQLCTQGPCSDSASGRQHEGVASLVPADAAPGTAVNRQEDTVQDGHKCTHNSPGQEKQ